MPHLLHAFGTCFFFFCLIQIRERRGRGRALFLAVRSEDFLGISMHFSNSLHACARQLRQFLLCGIGTWEGTAPPSAPLHSGTFACTHGKMACLLRQAAPLPQGGRKKNVSHPPQTYSLKIILPGQLKQLGCAGSACHLFLPLLLPYLGRHLRPQFLPFAGRQFSGTASSSSFLI